jgi:hypothetical protein
MSCHSIVVVYEHQYTRHIYCAFEVISPVTTHNFRGVVHKFQIIPSGPLRGGGCKWGNLPGPPDQGGGVQKV